MARSREQQAEYNAHLLHEEHAWQSEVITRMGSCCWRCGSKDKLEIDHIDKHSKKYVVTKGWRRPDIDRELTKCQLLCKPCHEKKHNTRANYLDALGL